MKVLQLTKLISRTMAGTTIALALSQGVAAQGVPSGTYFQAAKLINLAYPNATNLDMKRYEGLSVNGIVGKVLNASTEITFTVDGKEHKVIMLPDGQHLLKGEIIKPEAAQESSKPEAAYNPPQARLLPKKNSPSIIAAMQKPSITSPHRANNSPMADYVLKASDLDNFSPEADTDPESYFSKIEKHDAITTGRGPNHVYIFTDPNCPNCQKEYLSSLKYHDRFTFHWIPIYALTREPTIKQVALSQLAPEMNQANLELLMTNPAATAEIAPQLKTTNAEAKVLQSHQMKFYNLKDKRTPVTLYRNAQGMPVKVTGYNAKLFDYIAEDMTPGQQ